MRNADGKTPWDLAEANEDLKGSDAYWRLNDARFNAPGRQFEVSEFCHIFHVF